jgi:hypothetical protein
MSKPHIPKVVAEYDFTEYAEQNMGYCKACREFTHDCCEPDARNYECPECGESEVFGAEEAMLIGIIEVT